MAILWISSAVLLLVVVPVVVKLLNGVKAPVKEIERQSEFLVGAAPTLNSNLDTVDKLPRTRELTGQTRDGVARYGGALDQILG